MNLAIFTITGRNLCDLYGLLEPSESAQEPHHIRLENVNDLYAMISVFRKSAANNEQFWSGVIVKRVRTEGWGVAGLQPPNRN